MTDLSSIPDLEESSQELLDAAGFADLASLASASPAELTNELARANEILKIAKRAPDRATVATWIRAAREARGEPEAEDEEATVEPINREVDPEVEAQLAVAPCAIPLPARQLVAKNLAVSEIPPAELLSQYSGDLDVRVTERQSSQRRQANAGTSYVQVAEPAPQRIDIDTARVKSTEEFLASTPRRPASTRSEKRDDRVALLRAPREETNRGKDPNSRRYIRGVLHTHPNSLRFGAVVTLVTMIVLPVAIVSGLLLLLSDLVPETFAWVPTWLLAFPIALPVLGIAYLIWGISGRCRICGQRLFMPRACRKNVKAHHVPGLGYIIPVSVHMLLFRWFRCTFCGTPVRLKK